LHPVSSPYSKSYANLNTPLCPKPPEPPPIPLQTSPPIIPTITKVLHSATKNYFCCNIFPKNKAKIAPKIRSKWILPPDHPQIQRVAREGIPLLKSQQLIQIL